MNRIRKRTGLLIAVAFFAAIVLGSCSMLMGEDGKVFLAIDWDSGTLVIDGTDMPYPYTSTAYWDWNTYYEVEPGYYTYAYGLDTDGDTGTFEYGPFDCWMELTANEGEFLSDGEEIYVDLYLGFYGPFLWDIKGVKPVEKAYSSDGSYSMTTTKGKYTITLKAVPSAGGDDFESKTK